MKMKFSFLVFFVIICSSNLYSYNPVDTVWSRFESSSDFLVSPDGSYIVVLESNNDPLYPRLYSAESGTFIMELDSFSSPWYLGMAFSPDSRYLAISGYGNNVVIWDMENFSVIKEFTDDSMYNYTSNVCFSPTGDTIAFQSGYKLFLVDFETKSILRSVKKSFSTEKMQFTPDGKKLVLKEEQKNYLIIIDIDSIFDVWKTIEVFDDWVIDFSISPDGSKIVACDKDDLYIINTADQSILYHIDYANSGKGIAKCLFPITNNYVLYYETSYPSDTTVVYLFNYIDSTVLRAFNIPINDNWYLSNDDVYLYAYSYDALIKIQLDWTQSIFYGGNAGSEITVRPNPVCDKSAVNLTQIRPGFIQAYICDARGVKVRELFSGTAEADMISLPLNAEGLVPGIYFCIVETAGGIRAEKIVVDR